jgi:hypothetical protein
MNSVRTTDDILVCPRCHDSHSYLHHGKVTVYDRREGAPRLTKIEVLNGAALIKRVDSDGSGNPSTRRDGLAIHFECEICGLSSELTIAQHKGQTWLGWR